MNFLEQSTRKPRLCENGCGFCMSCNAYPLLKAHDNFGHHHIFQDYSPTRSCRQLKVKAYRSDEVVYNTIKYICTGTVGNHNLQHLQNDAQQRWRNRWFQHAGLRLDGRELSDLRFYFDVFNEYFFWGTLSSTDIQWADHQRMTEMDRLGYETLFEYGSFHGISHIRLREPGIHDSQTPNVSLRILGTLLHEMVHAMIDLYSCSCCCAINSEGVMGHGPAWMRLGQAVEACANKAFPEAGKWDLGVQFTDVSYYREVKRVYELGAFERLREKTMLWEMKWLQDFCSKGELQNQSA